MNRVAEESEFRAAFHEVLTAIDRQSKPAMGSPYAGAGEVHLHEHDTRRFFLDRLFELLGWKLGPAGNVAEEARIKGDTVQFVDYLGVNAETRAPVLILEAKSWDKPVVRARRSSDGNNRSDLVVRAIRHINGGGKKEDSPVIGEWHDNLEQLAGYVKRFKEQYGHEVPRAVLSSGQWILIFKSPVETFGDAEVNDQQFCLIERKDYIDQAHVIFELMARVVLADTAPTRIRSTQLGNYVNALNFSAAFHGLLVKYEASGSQLLVQQPRILVYPTIFVLRDDQAIFTVIDDENPSVLQLSQTGSNGETIAPHLEEVSIAARSLLARCANELAIQLEASELEEFPGFPESSALAPGGLALGSTSKLLVRPVRRVSDNWLAVTGVRTHYLFAEPSKKCRFHSWVECKSEGRSVGPNAVNSPSIDSPRVFFVDSGTHHCAHQSIVDRRADRCHIKAIDSRTCCKACLYQTDCWSAQEEAALPCGK